MKSIIYALGMVLAVAFAQSGTAQGNESAVLAGRVIKVVDGDTIDVQLQSGPIRIRFHGVDAPDRILINACSSTLNEQ